VGGQRNGDGDLSPLGDPEVGDLDEPHIALAKRHSLFIVQNLRELPHTHEVGMFPFERLYSILVLAVVVLHEVDGSIGLGKDAAPTQ
jgi:hypothetical protein